MLVESALLQCATSAQQALHRLLQDVHHCGTSCPTGGLPLQDIDTANRSAVTRTWYGGPLTAQGSQITLSV
jgi:hypothetical protein